MFLEKVELQGFKTFAPKTALEFLVPAGGSRGVTAIVGPNGSGKSNLADAVRWVLGEQSLKLLRGKKSEDVIFSGTDKRARAGFAEVTLTINCEDQADELGFTTIAITRRLYRDGQSEYLINSRPVRLTDIQIFLAQANFGQRSYAVIGQGMVDHILVASPVERKEFFDEAAGVKQFILKRHQAETKLETTRENLGQAEGLLREIEPRLRSLSRQVRKLEERGPVEAEFKMLARAYYGTRAREIQNALTDATKRAGVVDALRTKQVVKLDALRHELEAMESAEEKAAGLLELQRTYETTARERAQVREEYLKLQNTIEIAKMQTTKVGTIPTVRIIHDLEGIVSRHREFLDRLDHVHSLDELTDLKTEFRALSETAHSLLMALTGPAKKTEVDAELLKKQTLLDTQVKAFDAKLATLQENIRSYATTERKERGRFFELQREWEAAQGELTKLDRDLGDIKVAIARLETQRDSLATEVTNEMKIQLTELIEGELPTLTLPPQEAAERLRRLRTQLELIGSIDPETIREHQETEERHNFLRTQIDDLTKAMADLESGIEELNRVITERSDAAFKMLNHEFDRYFKQLFSGGNASLSKTIAEDDEDELGTESETTEEIKPKATEYTGIEIQASPPGKRVKSINMLSGGERALTSIALICAIMATNPSPFVVLDEVDAALDESNSIRFAEIVSELATKTQFVVITHNRAAMQVANVLYGVTIGDDGASRMLSLKIEEVDTLRNKTRVVV